MDPIDVDLSERVSTLDLSKLSDPERAELETVIADSESRVFDLQRDLSTVRRERDLLERRVDDLQTEVENLRAADAVGGRLHEPATVLRSFRDSIAATEADLAGEGFAVDDFEVDLKTAVVATDDGVRLHLPSLGEKYDLAELSSLRFGLRPAPERPELYVEVPDVREASEAGARRILEARGFAVAVTSEPGAREGVVLDQRPAPFAVGPRGETVELVVSDGSRAGTSAADRDRSDLPVIEVDGIGPTYADRLAAVGVETFGDLLARDPTDLAEASGLSAERISDWQHRAREHDPEE